MVVVAAVLAAAVAAAAGDRDAVGTAFTYQGVLEVDGVPVDGTYDLRFTLWDAETDGTQAGAAVERTGVAVEDGLVNEVLDFGEVLGPEAFWLEIAVRETGTADWTVLAPRQRLRPAPQAAEAERLGGHEASFFLDTSGTAQTKNGSLTIVGLYTQTQLWQHDLQCSGAICSHYGQAIVATVAPPDDDPWNGRYYYFTAGRFENERDQTSVDLANWDYGGHFVNDRLGSEARLAGGTGITAQGETAGLFLNNEGTASATVATLTDSGQAWGILAYGQRGGGYFKDSDGSGKAWVAWSDDSGNEYGISAEGNWAGGYFEDSDGSGKAWVGYSDGSGNEYGILAEGDTAGGRFRDPDGDTHVLLAMPDGSGGYGVFAGGGHGGGYLYDADGSGKAYIGVSFGSDEYGIYASGDTAGGYFEDPETGKTGRAYVGKGDWGIQAYGDWKAGEFLNEGGGVNASLAYSTYSIYGTGTKNFVQNHPEDPESVVVYTALEGPTVDTYTRGTARLLGDEVRVPLDPTFRLVTDPDLGLTASVTPLEDGCELYVVGKSTTELVVRSSRGEDCRFDYVVYGLRIGFEDVPAIRPKDVEAKVPSMRGHRELLARRPELWAVTGRGRFEAELEAAGVPVPKDLGRSAALLAAIGEYDPAVDRPARPARPAPPDAVEGVRDAAPPAPRPGAAVRRETPAAAQVAAAERAAGAADAGVPAAPSDRVVVRVEAADATPGAVLAYDGASGGYVPAARASDPTVVGIVVGADPAGGVDVAVAGVVECLVDATYGRVVPGDLLVASPTPGYAMRASDPMPGAVVAKALEELEGGVGTVRVLVMGR
jgi:hypothetical protein